MKIVAFEIADWERKTFKDLQKEHEVVFAPDGLNADNVEQFSDADIITTFIYSDLGHDVLCRFENLSLIATRSTGFDHIDLDCCQERNITVSNVPTYGQNTVAEHVFGLLLTISHKLYDAIDRTRKGDFSLQGLEGFDLKGKTLGVIGTGDIGEHVIRIAKGFQMDVVAFDVKPREEIASVLGFRYADMDEVLAQADVLTLHVPANEKTHHLISHDQFAKMKKGAVLINTARGTVVDIGALGRALADGKITAAGLDTLPEEPVIREETELLRPSFQEQHNLKTLLSNHVLLRLRHVYITPHSAFNTCEALQRIIDTTAENIRAFIAGDPQNTVLDAG